MRQPGTNILLAVCAVLVGFGILTIAVSPGFFMSLLGAGIMATGGAAAYLISSHRMCADDNHPKRLRAPNHLTCRGGAGRERGDRLADQWICRFSAFGVLRDVGLEEKSFVSTLLLMPIVAMFAGDR